MSETLIRQPEQENQPQHIALRAEKHSLQDNLRNIGIIIGREFKNRIRQRAFKIVTVILVIVALIGAFIPLIIQVISANTGGNSATNVTIIDNAGYVAGLSDVQLKGYFIGALGDSFTVTNADPTQQNALIQQVKNGKANNILVLQRDANGALAFVFYTSDSSSTFSNSDVTIQAVASRLGVFDNATRQGLSSQQVYSILTPATFKVTTLGTNTNVFRADNVVGIIMGYLGNILIYMAVMLYGIGVAQGVAEEKGNRIMEILVNAASPLQLMVGKIVGIGLAGLLQMGIFVGAGVAALAIQLPLKAGPLASVIGTSGLSFSVDGMMLSMFLLFLLYFILGYALFAVLFAAIGAVVSRQDEVQQAATPVTLLLIVGYLLSYVVLSSPNALWVKITSYVPFWSPTIMLMRVGTGTVEWWEILMTVLIMLVTFFFCSWIAARIYRQGVLMYGQKPGLGRMLKLAGQK